MFKRGDSRRQRERKLNELAQQSQIDLTALQAQVDGHAASIAKLQVRDDDLEHEAWFWSQ